MEECEKKLDWEKPVIKEYISYDYIYMKFKTVLICGNIGSFLGAWCSLSADGHEGIFLGCWECTLS